MMNAQNTTMEIIGRLIDEGNLSSANKRYLKTKVIDQTEKKFGKTLFDMDKDELFDFFSSLVSGSTLMSFSTYLDILGVYRKLFDYYYELGGRTNVNLWGSDFRGKKGFDCVNARRQKSLFEMEDFKIYLKLIDQNFDKEYANYIKMVLWLYYDGIMHNQEFLEINQDDIDFQKKTATLKSGRTIHFSDQTIDLMEKVTKYHAVPTGRYKMKMSRIKEENYLKFPISDDADWATLANRLGSSLSKVVNKVKNLEDRYKGDWELKPLSVLALNVLGIYGKLKQLDSYLYKSVYKILNQSSISDDDMNLLDFVAKEIGFGSSYLIRYKNYLLTYYQNEFELN